MTARRKCRALARQTRVRGRTHRRWPGGGGRTNPPQAHLHVNNYDAVARAQEALDEGDAEVRAIRAIDGNGKDALRGNFVQLAYAARDARLAQSIVRSAANQGRLALGALSADHADDEKVWVDSRAIQVRHEACPGVQPRRSGHVHVLPGRGRKMCL